MLLFCCFYAFSIYWILLYRLFFKLLHLLCTAISDFKDLEKKDDKHFVQSNAITCKLMSLSIQRLYSRHIILHKIFILGYDLLFKFSKFVNCSFILFSFTLHLSSFQNDLNLIIHLFKFFFGNQNQNNWNNCYIFWSMDLDFFPSIICFIILFKEVFQINAWLWNSAISR